VNIESLASGIARGTLGPLAFGIAFLGGLVAGLGPCVLPMLPAVFGYVTGMVATDSGRSDVRSAPLRGLLLAVVFVLGMSTVFSVIGATAGLIGRALIVGAWAYYFAAAVCVVIALQMLGVIRLPIDRVNALLPVRRPDTRGVLGIFLFGMLFGLVATPCSTPILAAIATVAAAGKSVLGGAALLFVYGLGKGVPLFALGVASGSLGLMRSMSKATPTLTKVGGVGLLGAALYLVWLA
jgi:cytochrome c-type biogenesis protein